MAEHNEPQSRRAVRVVILQEYVPAYRSALFSRLQAECFAHGIELQVAAGEPGPHQAARGDRSDFPVLEIRQTELKLGRRRITLRRVGHYYRDFDYVIVEQARRNLDLYVQLVFRPQKVALWGHGRDVVEKRSSASRALLAALTKRAFWFFAYTDGGARAVAARGFPSSRITVVVNSTDTRALNRVLEGLPSETRETVATRYGLTDRTAIFVGALDASKRIEFLLESARHAARLDPDFRLVVVGDGPLGHLVDEEASSHRHVVRLEGRTGQSLAEIACAAQVLAMPGRVGLVAVDALALGLPVIMTDWSQNGPEREYLSDSTAVTSADDTASFARAMLSVLQDQTRRSRMSEACVREARRYSAEAAASNFRDGIVRMVRARRE